jgi:DNA-binding LacI/PurR family transcriptional regulator
MADVAVVAGVSHMTVSRVLNNPGSVKPATRDRVQAAMRSLGYRPNIVARALATGRTRRIGVLALATALYGPTSTLLSIEAAARVAGYQLDIVRLRAVTRRSVAEAADGLQGRGVDGIIGITPHTWAPKALQSAISAVPLVAVEGAEGHLPTVAVDQEQGAILATEHLLGLGHATVWHVAGPRDWLEAKARLRAWRETLQRADRTVPPVLPGDWGVGSGYTAGRRLAEEPGVTAVFVGNDQMALGVLRALLEAGLRVPDHVSVVGFDDVPEAAYFTPPLTTVRQDFDEVGRLALKLLLDQLADGSTQERHVMIESRLVVRQSTAPPP